MFSAVKYCCFMTINYEIGFASQIHRGITKNKPCFFKSDYFLFYLRNILTSYFKCDMVYLFKKLSPAAIQLTV